MSKKITLLIEKFQFEAVIGLLEKERETPQKVEVWAKIEIKYKKKSLVDYALLCDVIKNTMQSGKFFTVEEALLCLCDKISAANPKIKKIFLKILKPEIIENTAVGASIKKIFKIF
ncbi:MAG: dihydroneopterin aldolase [Campylobacteraceae bacterium]|nr:dihydroneopterin aldolase [Campylobacteraceae bacterium]